MRFLAVLALLASCSAPVEMGVPLDAPEWQHQALPSQTSPPPGSLVLEPVDFWQGETAIVTASGLTEGDTATLIISIGGLGDGPCPAILGGMCLEIMAPLATMGSATADDQGVATFTIPVPQNVAWNVLYAQVVRGGITPDTSNGVAIRVLRHGGDSDNDGLSDDLEITIGTDPIDADTDDGGVVDGWEVAVDGTDPHNPVDDMVPDTGSPDTDPPPPDCPTGDPCGVDGVCIDAVCEAADFEPTVDQESVISATGLSHTVIDAHGDLAAALIVHAGSTYQLQLYTETAPGGHHTRGTLDIVMNSGLAPYVSARKGNILYVGQNEINVVDVTNPDSPSQLDDVDTSTHERLVYDLIVDGDRLISRGTHGVSIYDITNPATPIHTSFSYIYDWDLPSATVWTHAGRGALHNGHYYFSATALSGSNLNHLMEFDLRGADPIEVSATLAATTASSVIAHVTRIGDDLFFGTMAGSASHTWARFDASTPGSVVASGAGVPDEGAWAVAPSGRHLLLAPIYGGQELEVWDMMGDPVSNVHTTWYSFGGHHPMTASDSTIWLVGTGPGGYALYTYAR